MSKLLRKSRTLALPGGSTIAPSYLSQLLRLVSGCEFREPPGEKRPQDIRIVAKTTVWVKGIRCPGEYVGEPWGNRERERAEWTERPGQLPAPRWLNKWERGKEVVDGGWGVGVTNWIGASSTKDSSRSTACFHWTPVLSYGNLVISTIMGKCATYFFFF